MSKLTMMICPHDTVKEPDRWYRLEQYLVQRLGLALQFNLSLDFEDFHSTLQQADIAYLNPMDCLRMRATAGFIPLVRAADRYDEAIIVASTETAAPTLQAVQGAKIASVVSQIPTGIALMMLKEQGVTPGSIENRDSWLSVISAIWNGEVPFGVVYKDTYDNLSDHGKSLVQPFATSQLNQAFHCLSVGPRLSNRAVDITALLLDMPNDPTGSEVLAELNIRQWVEIMPEELTQMQALLDAANN